MEGQFTPTSRSVNIAHNDEAEPAQDEKYRDHQIDNRVSDPLRKAVGMQSKTGIIEC